MFFVLIAEGSSEVNKTMLIKGLISPLKEVHKLSLILDRTEEKAIHLVQPRLNTCAVKFLVLDNEFSRLSFF